MEVSIIKNNGTCYDIKAIKITIHLHSLVIFCEDNISHRFELSEVAGMSIVPLRIND